MKNLSILIFTLLISCYQLNAQDRIIKVNNDTINCMVKEISTDEVKYIVPETSNTILFAIDKNEISKIILENGKELSFSHSLYGIKTYQDQRKHALKLNFLAPLTGNTTISYERLIRPSRSWEASLGIIGLGIDQNEEKPRGVFGKFGMKFIKNPDFYLKGMRYAHVLKGTYVKPELTFSIYSREDQYIWESSIFSSATDERKTNWAAAFNIIVGKQYVFNDVLLLDVYLGAGYGYSRHDNYDDVYHYGFLGADSETPLTLTAGVKIGLLLK